MDQRRAAAGPVDLRNIRPQDRAELDALRGMDFDQGLPCARLDWVVVGGESGPGARPMHPDWARSLRDQCAAAGVPFHFKQWGAWAPGECVTRQSGTVGAAWYDGPSWTIGAESLSRADGHVDDEPDVYRIGKKAAGRLLDGVTHDGFPESGRVAAEGSRRG